MHKFIEEMGIMHFLFSDYLMLLSSFMHRETIDLDFSSAIIKIAREKIYEKNI